MRLKLTKQKRKQFSQLFEQCVCSKVNIKWVNRIVHSFILRTRFFTFVYPFSTCRNVLSVEAPSVLLLWKVYFLFINWRLVASIRSEWVSLYGFLSKRNVHGVWCGRRCVYITIVLYRGLIHIHVKRIWTVVDGFRFMCIHTQHSAVKGEGDCLFGMCCVYCVYMNRSFLLVSLWGKAFSADWQWCRDVIDTDRGRKVKLDTARSRGGKKRELRRLGRGEKEKKRE